MTDDDIRGWFVEQLGLVTQEDGLPRIAGRIMGLLILEGEPLGFAEIAERLDISRGSVSTNTRLLERLGVIERTARFGDRQDYFQIAPRPYVRLMQGSLDRIRRAREVVARTQAVLPAEDRGAHQRLDEMASFYAAIGETLEELLQRITREA